MLYDIISNINMQKVINKSPPIIDVFMPVYNAQAYLRQALNSVLKQTYPHWRLLICDDASSDHSWSIIQEFAQKDSRITAIRNRHNLGNGGTTMKMLPKLKSQYIARMDADDISMPDRFAKQIKFLQANPQVVAIGGQCLLIDKKGRVFGEKKFSTDAKDAYESMFVGVPAQYPAVMFNLKLIPKQKKWYGGISNIIDDVNLFFNISRFGEITNLPDYVLKYRIHGQNSTLVDPKKTFRLTFQQRLKAIKTYHYRPTIKGWLTNFAQLIVVSLVPNKLIVPLFFFTKGVKLS